MMTKAVEQKMLALSLRYHTGIQNHCQTSDMKDIVLATRQNKIHWAGHVVPLADSRCKLRVTKWYALDKRGLPGRPAERGRTCVGEMMRRE